MSLTAADLLTLARRYPLSVACGVLTLLLGVGAYFLWDDIDRLEADHQARAKEGGDNMTLLVGASTQRNELAAAREAAQRIDDNLAIESELPENNRYFYKFEEQTRAHLAELHQLNAPITDTGPLYKRIPYTVRVTGTYEQVAAFLLALETGPRLVNLTSFSFSRAAAAAGGRTGGRDAAADTAPGVTLDLSLELLARK
jgi:Tfp pilus assembly protein PilO